MPNPYDDIFEENGEENKKLESNQSEFSPIGFDKNEDFKEDVKEPLDEIVESLQLFQNEAESFSQLLSRNRAIDHKEINGLASLFFADKKLKDKLDLQGERDYHKLLKNKFERIIIPMKSLAKIHLTTVRQFNRDINKDYYSIDKTDKDVDSEIEIAIDGINMQRKILADAANDLNILENALKVAEGRIEKFINVGGTQNISKAELEIIIQKRQTLTSGRDFQFDYSIFEINILDKTVISLGFYMKETSSQYFGKLLKAFDLD